MRLVVICIFTLSAILTLVPSYLKAQQFDVISGVEFRMKFDVRSRSGFANVEWKNLQASDTLSNENADIILAAFVYARSLIIHSESRSEMMRRVSEVALHLIDGRAEWQKEPWLLDAGGLQFQIYPWGKLDRHESDNVITHNAALLEAQGRIGGILELSSGLERVHVPPLPLLAIETLALRLGAAGRKTLGETLLGVRDFYMNEERPFQVGSDQMIVQSLLQNLSQNPETRGEVFSSKHVLMAKSKELARRMGRAHQLQINCAQPSRLRPEFIAGLFINYMDEPDVQVVMNEYGSGLSGVAKDKCDRQKMSEALRSGMADLNRYIHQASPFMRPR